MAPLISVVIPACNAAQYVGAAVASVLGQTLDSLEVIVVDDGSTDGTAAVVEAVRDSRVRVIVRHNGGPSAARNTGVRASRATRFIAFLDADDCWDREKLARQVAFLDGHPECVVVGSLMRYVSSTGRVLGCSGQQVGASDRDRIARAEWFPFPLSSFLVRREVLDSIGGFDESLGRPRGGAEDMELLARLAACGEVGCVAEPLGSYRIHPGSAMARDRKRINREARFVRTRLTARRAGADLAWDEFARSMPDSWRDRWQDTVEVCYRTAGLWYAEGRPVKAFAYAAMAALINPYYTFRRAHQQRQIPESYPVGGTGAA